MKLQYPLALILLVSAPMACSNDKGSDPMAAKDGQAQPHDMAAMNAEEFARFDGDNSGQLSRTELPKDHALAAHFDMLDTDKSGTLSAAEFANGNGM